MPLKKQQNKTNNMLYTHFFQYNIPAENQCTNDTGKYVNVLAEWENESYYTSGKPMVSVRPVNFTFYDCILIKDWHKALNEIKALAENHFASIAKQEKINQARAVLMGEGDLTGIPTLDRIPTEVVKVVTQKYLG
jgi:hypothetical protein